MALLRLRRATATAILCGLIGLTLAVAARPAAADVGFSDGSVSGASAPSGLKPPSKPWGGGGGRGGDRGGGDFQQSPQAFRNLQARRRDGEMVLARHGRGRPPQCLGRRQV